MRTIRPGLKERNLFINVIFSSPSHPPAQLRLLQKTFGFRFVLCTRFPVATKQCSISHEYLFRKRKRPLAYFDVFFWFKNRRAVTELYCNILRCSNDKKDLPNKSFGTSMLWRKIFVA